MRKIWFIAAGLVGITAVLLLTILWLKVGLRFSCHSEALDETSAIKIGMKIASEEFGQAAISNSKLSQEFEARMITPSNIGSSGYPFIDFIQNELLLGAWIVTTRPQGPLPMWNREDIMIIMGKDAGCIVSIRVI